MTNDSRVPEWLVDEISDVFNVLPLIEALRGLGQLIDEKESELYSLYEDVAPKYRDVGLEQGLEAVTIILGAGFVAAQSILTSTFVSVKRLAKIDIVQSTSSCNIPTTKSELFQIAAYDRMGVPDIVGINALANFFKHSSEWSYDWSGLTRTLEIETASTAKKLGLRPGDPDNMMKGASALMFGGHDGLSKLASRVSEWRESVTVEMKQRLKQSKLLS